MAKLPILIRAGFIASKIEDAIRPLQLFVDSLNARGLGKIVAAPALLTSIMAVFGETGMSALRARGWRVSWGPFLEDYIIETLDPAKAIQLTNNNERLWLWWDEGVAVTSNERIILAPDGRPERWLRSVIEPWGIAELTTSPKADRYELSWTFRRTHRIGSIIPISSSPLDTLRRAIRGGGRTVVLYGETGAGKTELALHATSQDGVRLVVDAGSRATERPYELCAIANAIGAKVIILDDFPVQTGIEALTAMKAMREAQKVTGITVIVTIMTSGKSLRLPGLRPGRVEEMIPVSLPTDADREALLRHYGLDEEVGDLVKRTGRWTPAFLRELALRVRRGDGHDEAVKSIQDQIGMMPDIDRGDE